LPYQVRWFNVSIRARPTERAIQSIKAFTGRVLTFQSAPAQLSGRYTGKELWINRKMKVSIRARPTERAILVKP